jgi:hypothetical protein
MTLLCSRCGRVIKASAIPEPTPGVSVYAALGPVCAKRVGLLAENPRRHLFVLMRRRRAADARQMELPV